MPARNTKTKLQAETLEDRVQKRFLGMYKDIPASELPNGCSALNRNIVDYGIYSEGRTGSKVYANTTKPVGTLNGRLDSKKSKKIVKMYGTSVYICDKLMQEYQEVLNISGQPLSNKQSAIIEFGEDVLIFNPSTTENDDSDGGIFLLVLSDDFPHLRRMNQPLPDTIIEDLAEEFSSTDVSELPYGYRYIYSLVARKGSNAAPWTRISDSDYPIVFESGTTAWNSIGKDYGERYYERPCYRGYINEFGVFVPYLGNVVETFSVPIKVQDATHFGVYRTKNIGHNSEPPGIDPVNGLGNNAQQFIWVTDIPVCKAFYGAVVDGVFTPTQGFLEEGDRKNILRDSENPSVTFELEEIVASASVVAVVNISAASERVWVMGGGRAFKAYQSGRVIVKVGGDTWTEDDVGLPIFWADGRISWISRYYSITTVGTDFDQEIETQAATMRPTDSQSNFERLFNDTIPDDGTGLIDNDGSAQIGLQQILETGEPIYSPRRAWTPLPNCNIGMFDLGFVYTALRDGTRWRYTQTGDKAYCVGYYRPDIQQEMVESQIRSIEIIGSIVAIIMRSKTRVANPAVASNVGNTNIGETVYFIPPSFKADDAIGVIAWQSIAHKGSGLIYAITNEPAMRSFDGNGWSTQNFAKDQVQKDLEMIDPYQKVVAVYISGKHGGYKIWFKKWVS